MAEYIISVDVGTSSCKTVLFDTEFNVIATAREKYETSYPHQGWAEQPADQWWDALKENTKEMLEKSSVDPAKVIAVGIDAKELVASDNSKLHYSTNSVTLGGGMSVDAILDTTGVPAGEYYLYASNLQYLANNDAPGLGGMMTMIVIE